MIVGNIKYLNNLKDFKSQNSVKSNFIDDEIFKDAISETNRIKQKMYSNNEKTPFFNQLSKDMFNALYKIRPEVYSKENLHKSLHMENDIFNKLIDNEKFNKLRRNTCGDVFNSTISLGMFQDMAVDIIEEWVEQNKENKETMDNINNAIEKQQQLENLMNQLQNGEADKNTEKQIKSLEKQIDKLNNKIEHSDFTDYLNEELENVIKQIDKEVQKNQDALDNFGIGKGGGSGGEGTPNKVVPFEQKKKLIETLKRSCNFKDIMDQLGRMKEMVGKINKKPSKYGHTICDVGTGNNLNKILSTEKVKLIDENLEYEFYKKYSNKTLLEYKTQGMEEGRGPVVVCLDISGSMEGDSELWSKTVTIATLQLAVNQKRAFRCITFNYKVDKVLDFDKSMIESLEKIVELSETTTWGGTNFEAPLEKALESIEESKFKKADVLFITDGYPDDYLSEDFKSRFNNTKTNKGFTVQSIMIGNSNTSYLDEFSDNVITMNDLNKDGELVNIFNNMKSE